MYLTISSVLTYCTLVSALAMLICFLLNQNKILCRIGSKCALILSQLLIGRMFLPFEFDFTYTLNIKWVLPYVREVLNYELIGGKWSVSVWMIFVFIWGAGTAFCLVKKLSLYKGISQCIRLSKKEKVNSFLERKGLEKLKSPEGERVQIIHMQGLHTPCIVGFRSAYILFPDKVYSAEEVSLIIQHEMMHYKRKDILWKSVIDILCSFFWWNPVFCYLKKTVFRIVEIGDDTALTSTMSEREKISYMECLINLAVDQRSSEIPFGVSFGENTIKEIKQRIRIMNEDVKCVRWMSCGAVLGVMGCLFLISFVIFEPYYEPVGMEGEESIPFNYKNSFFIRNGNAYDLYENGEYQFTTEDEELVKSFRKLEVYNSMEERENDD